MKVKDLWKPGRLVTKLYELPGSKKKGKKKGKKGKGKKTRKPIKGNVQICVDPKGLERRPDGGPPHNLVEKIRVYTDLERFNRENKPKHPFQVIMSYQIYLNLYFRMIQLGTLTFQKEI